MIQNILVPLDGSAFGERALDWAALLANRSDGRLHLVHVRTSLIVADPMLQYTLVDIETPEEAHSYMKELVRRLGAGVRANAITQAVLEGAVAESLCQYARDHGIDLVVMTTHARGPWAKFWEGSVAETLVRTLPVSILLLRATEDGPDQPPPAVGFQQILMPIGHDLAPDGVGGMAFALARLFGGSVTLLHVRRPEGKAPTEPKAEAASPDQFALPSTMIPAIEATQKRAVEAGISVQILVVPHDDLPTAILSEAARLQCDLIAMETSCRTGLARLVKGSTAERIVRTAAVPVLLHCSRHSRVVMEPKPAGS